MTENKSACVKHFFIMCVNYHPVCSNHSVKQDENQKTEGDSSVSQQALGECCSFRLR